MIDSLPVPSAGTITVFGFEGVNERAEVTFGSAAFLDERDRVVNAASKLSSFRKNISSKTWGSITGVPPITVPSLPQDGLTIFTTLRGSPAFPVVLQLADPATFLSVWSGSDRNYILFRSWEDMKLATRPAAQVFLKLGNQPIAEILDHEIFRARFQKEMDEEDDAG